MHFTRKNPTIHAWPIHDVIEAVRADQGADSDTALMGINALLVAGLDDEAFHVSIQAGYWVLTQNLPVEDPLYWTAGWLVYDGERWSTMTSLDFWETHEVQS